MARNVTFLANVFLVPFLSSHCRSFIRVRSGDDHQIVLMGLVMGSGLFSCACPAKGTAYLRVEVPPWQKARSHVAWMAGNGGNAVF